MKKGGPTEILLPVIASEITGNSVPQKTAKQITTKIKLLKRNPLSLEVTDSIFLGDRKSSMRKYINPNEPIRMINTNIRNTGPKEDSVNE